MKKGISVGRTDGKPMAVPRRPRVKRFRTEAAAVDFVGKVLWEVDPAGVRAGDYYIDAPEGWGKG